MARKRSRRKEPNRFDFRLKERYKIEEGVLDTRSVLKLRRLFNHNIIAKLDFIIEKGKEADVYVADPGSKIKEGFVVVKMFRMETSNFYKRVDYMHGDPRFGKIKGGIYDLVSEWCKKEYGNLKIAQDAGVHAPKPYFRNENVLAMEFIGEDGIAARQLRKTILEEPEKAFDSIIEDIKKLYENNLVHADVSEYNVLVKNGIPYLIDFGQAVVLKHPKADAFLERDIINITYYFNKRYNLGKDYEKVLAYVKGSGSI